VSACGACAADLTEDDVLLKIEVQSWGHTSGMQPIAHEEASDGVAMSMASDATAVGGLKLEAGDYTLLFFDYAPAGDQDAFFVEIGGERSRLKGHIGSWGTIVHQFSVAETGSVTIAVIGQEAGMTLDRMAVVRGSYPPGEIAFADVPGETKGESVGLHEISRLASPCRLAEPPEQPLPPDDRTVYSQDFEQQCEGVVGEHRWIEGPFGQALVLDMPDGRFDIDASDLQIAERGTIEWWVKPREAARVWWDQGWHYFLHAEPAQPGGTQLDLEKHIRSLSLITTPDSAAYELTEGTNERAQFGVGDVSIEDWHHMLVSWDFSGERQYIWLMMDGRGMQSFFPRTFEPGGFSRIELCNTPSDWEIPYLPMDGALDAVRISDISVEGRLAE
jgi:hypothetical protein